jgi:hypothetical protein
VLGKKFPNTVLAVASYCCKVLAAIGTWHVLFLCLLRRFSHFGNFVVSKVISVS